MKLKRIASLMVLAGATLLSNSVRAEEEFTGDKKLACEAILCLSTGSRPSECSPSMDRYFGIKKKKLSDTLDARRDFLSICPAANESSEMVSLVQYLSRGAGRCDAASLNRDLYRALGSGGDAGYYDEYIEDKLPSYCAQYWGHEYVDESLLTVRYDKDLGRWVDQ
ncbi:TrbM/KikA/MpfK family conjugal transfer protein [Achromobacter spanius]|uniref:TrbM/KikA/MpfK family conjugal transfer protein n=1 Tax=Achromobacter spanius TaxID=217203 RepID=UPI00382E6EC3